MKIYIASKASHRPRWRELRDRFGVPIISRWIDVEDKFNDDPTGLDYEELWDWCVEDCKICDVLVVFAEFGEVLKGALVEVGVALSQKKRVIAVGPRSVFEQNGTWLNHYGIEHTDKSITRVLDELAHGQEG